MEQSITRVRLTGEVKVHLEPTRRISVLSLLSLIKLTITVFFVCLFFLNFK